MSTNKAQIGQAAKFTLTLSIPNYWESYKDNRKRDALQRKRIERRLTNYDLNEALDALGMEYEHNA